MLVPAGWRTPPGWSPARWHRIAPAQRCKRRCWLVNQTLPRIGIAVSLPCCMSGDPGSTERHSRVSARDGLAIKTRARTKPPGAARPLEFVVRRPGDTAALDDFDAGGGDSLRPARVELARRLRSREAELQEAVFANVCSVVPDATDDGDSPAERAPRSSSSLMRSRRSRP